MSDDPVEPVREAQASGESLAASRRAQHLQENYPPGDYAIVELFGHSTLVGRYAEVERFGTKMLALEPIFKGQLLGACFHGGAAIYRLTPCTPAVAFLRAPREDYQLPPTIRAAAPPELLAAPAPATQGPHRVDDDDEDEQALADDGL